MNASGRELAAAATMVLLIGAAQKQGTAADQGVKTSATQRQIGNYNSG